MINDYHHGEFPERNAFQTYFDWKEEKIDLQGISPAAALDMLDVCQQLLERYHTQYAEAVTPPEISLPFGPLPNDDDDPWSPYRAYGPDCYVISYLEAIQSDLRTILPVLG